MIILIQHLRIYFLMVAQPVKLHGELSQVQISHL